MKTLPFMKTRMVLGLIIAIFSFIVLTVTVQAQEIVTEEVTQTDIQSGVFIFATETNSSTPESVIEEIPLVEEVVPAAEEPSTTSEPADLISDDVVLEEDQEATIAEALPAPELSTDKGDYHPGETSTIFGKYFTPLQNFVLKIFGSDENDQNYTEQTETVTTDDNGAFSFQYVLDSLYRPFYEVVATTLSGDTVAETWFRDAAVSAYNQCSNDDGDGYASGDTGCRFINGALNASNSTYSEGDSTLQRLVLDGFAPGSVHTVTLQYGTTKQGKHAYDFLTSWSHSEGWATLADRCDGLAGCATAAESTFAIPNDINGSGQFQGTVGARNFVMRGATLSSATAPFLSGGYAGDSETSVTLTFTVGPSNGSMCDKKGPVTSCGVILWFGAHIAESTAWTAHNSTTGAGSINGAPYHIAVSALDGGAIGNRDNQMQANNILPPSATGVITIIKDTTPNDAQDFAFTTSDTGLSNFSLDDDLNVTLSNTQTFSELADGTYSVTETPFAGFDLTSLSCVDLTGGTVTTLGTGNASINLSGGETVTCTYTNTKRGSLTIVKNSVGGNDTFNFTGNTGVTTLTTVAGTANQVVSNILPGTYNIAETAKAGWTQTSATCSDNSLVSAIVVSAGENVTCTFTNTKNASLTLIKTVTNDNGGSAQTTAWTLAASGPTPISGVTGNAAVTNAVVDSGVYTLSENSGPSDYTASTYSCVKNATAPVVSNSITLAEGDTATCTINNNDNAPQLHLRKIVVNDNGGTKSVADFTLTANGAGANDVIGTSPVDSGAGLFADTFALSETSVPGYASSSWVCVGGTQNGANITLGLGQEATCTITNDDIAPKLTLIKEVVNDNGGGAVAGDWTLTATGYEGQSPDAGTYNLSESNGPSGYAQTSLTCSNAQGQVTSVTLGLSDDVTCTFVNDDIAPQLTVIKHVINDNGGNDAASSFTMNVTATNLSSASFAGAETPGITITLNAGAYSVDEGPHAGYSKALGANCVGTIALGESKICTITNDDISPKLTVTKVVINHGGSKGVSDFPLSVDTTTVVSGFENNVNAGTHTVSEVGNVDYIATISGDCNAQTGAVTLALGEVKACTITNEEKLAHLTVEKIVINHGLLNDATHFAPYKVDTTPVTLGVSNVFNSGSHTVTEVADTNYTATFSGACDAQGVVSLVPGDSKTCIITNEEKPATVVVHKVVVNHGLQNDATHFAPYKVGATTVTLDAVTDINSGTYTVTELVDANYTATFSGDCNAQGSLTVTPGSLKSCTITNTEIPAHLTVVKVVKNHGLTNDVTHFAPYRIDATTVTEGASNFVNSGVHGVSETTDVNYIQSFSSNCANGSITLAPGDEATCTITNEEKLSDITVKKVVINHGQDKNATDFGPYTVDTVGVTLDQATVFESGSHTVAEVGTSDYTQTFSGDCNEEGIVTLGSGEHKTCTITNEEKPAKIVVTKVVINNNGGTKEVKDFPLFVGATGVTSGNTNTFNSGTYVVSETGDAGYTSTISGDCDPQTGSVTFVAGETKTCTITNDDKPAHLIIIKHVDNGNTGATAVAGDFTTTIAGVTTANPVAVASEAGINNTLTTVGAYTVTEGAHAGYSMTASTDCAATIALGETKTCTITNTAIAPKLTVVKIVDNGNTGATTLPSAFQMMVDALDVPQNVAQTETVGTHTVTESGPSGYTSAFSGACDKDGKVSLTLGDDKTCTITNTAIAPKLTLIKTVVNDNGGTKVIANFPLSIDTTVVTSGVSNSTTIGLHTASEVSDAGYTASSWGGNCAADGTITLALGDDKTCTIINDDKPGHLIVYKITNPTDTTTEFSITATGGTIVSPTALQTIVGGESVDYTVNKGTYSVAEGVKAGWDETGNACIAVVVNNGETKECTITNTQKGHLIVDKVTLPTGDATSFAIVALGSGTITGGGAGSVTDTSNNDYEVTPGTYGVTETVPIGWDQTSSTCSGVVIAAGETKTCTITNIKRAKVTIVKDAQPQDVQDFVFSSVVLGGFTLDDDAGIVDPAPGEEFSEWSNTKSFDNVVSGALSVTEAQTNQYWKLKGALCVVTGTQNAVASTLVGNVLSFSTTPGADVTCTFVNEKISPTRTQGFWKTHTKFTSDVFASKFIPTGMTIGNAVKKTIDTTNKLFGAWYSSIPKTTTNAQRTALDKARMQLLQQLVTAKLNCANFGCTQSVKDMIAAADVAYSGTSASTIITSAGLLDVYNNSGDTIIIGNAGKATPKTSDSTADKVFWNSPGI